jgi:DNA-binding NarL/FixJ family response regulator
MIRERLVSLLEPVAGTQLIGFADRSDLAVSEIVRLRPDAVVLDLNLAHGTGVDVLRALQDSAPEVSVYVLTNFAIPQYRKLCMHLGASGFYDKSTEFEKVRDVIAARATQQFLN